MNSFTTTLSFSLLPLVLVTVFSLLLPSMGAVLAVRDEIMLALALPSIANAGMALGLLCGIDPEHELLLYGFATAATLVTILGASRLTTGNGRREIFLASLFIGGQILASSFSAMSPVAHNHVSHLLNGEVLAVGTRETMSLVMVCIVILIIGIIYFRTIFSWCADSEFFRIGSKRYRLFIFAVYAAFAVVITLGVATIGALLVTTLLVLPALFGDVNTGGIRRYIVISTLIGALGAISGFLVALGVDFPPAISASAGIGVVGICTKYLYRSK
jgi:zinc transport system permease protein